MEACVFSGEAFCADATRCSLPKPVWVANSYSQEISTIRYHVTGHQMNVPPTLHIWWSLAGSASLMTDPQPRKWSNPFSRSMGLINMLSGLEVNTQTSFGGAPNAQSVRECAAQM